MLPVSTLFLRRSAFDSADPEVLAGLLLVAAVGVLEEWLSVTRLVPTGELSLRLLPDSRLGSVAVRSCALLAGAWSELAQRF